MPSVQTWNIFVLVTIYGYRNGPFGTLGCNWEWDDRLKYKLKIYFYLMKHKLSFRIIGVLNLSKFPLKIATKIQYTNTCCALVCLSDLQLSREIFPVSESQCELISIYCKYTCSKVQKVIILSDFPCSHRFLLYPVPNFNLDSSFSCLSSTCALDNRFYFISS